MEWTEITSRRNQPVKNCLELSDISDFLKELKQMADCNFLAFEKNAFTDDVLNCTTNNVKLIKIVSFIFRFLRNCRVPNRR